MSVLSGFLSVLLIFVICFAAVVAVKIFTTYYKMKKNTDETQKTSDPKIYCITEKIVKKPVKKRRKKPNVALQGIIVRPEKFKIGQK